MTPSLYFLQGILTSSGSSLIRDKPTEHELSHLIRVSLQTASTQSSSKVWQEQLPQHLWNKFREHLDIETIGRSFCSDFCFGGIAWRCLWSIGEVSNFPNSPRNQIRERHSSESLLSRYKEGELLLNGVASSDKWPLEEAIVLKQIEQTDFTLCSWCSYLSSSESSRELV